MRLDVNKLEHFLDFINRPYFYQVVALGTQKFKLESGQVLKIPNIIRTVTRSTMVAQYVQFCTEDKFEPMNRATLFRILEVRGAPQRKAFQGLDKTVTDGIVAFDRLEKSVMKLEKLGASSGWIETTQKNRKDSKRYLRTRYRVHCAAEGACADHCK